MPNDTVSKIKRIAWLLEYMSFEENSYKKRDFFERRYPKGAPFPVRTAWRDLKLIKAAGIPCKGHIGKWDKRPAFTFANGFTWQALGLSYNTAASLCVLYETLGKDKYTFSVTRRTILGWLAPKRLPGCSLAPDLKQLPKTSVCRQLQQAIAKRQFVEIAWKKHIKIKNVCHCIRPTQFITINGEWYFGGLAATRTTTVCERIADISGVSYTVINTPVFKDPGEMRWKIWTAVNDKLASLSAQDAEN